MNVLITDGKKGRLGAGSRDLTPEGLSSLRRRPNEWQDGVTELTRTSDRGLIVSSSYLHRTPSVLSKWFLFNIQFYTVLIPPVNPGCGPETDNLTSHALLHTSTWFPHFVGFQKQPVLILSSRVWGLDLTFLVYSPPEGMVYTLDPVSGLERLVNKEVKVFSTITVMRSNRSHFQFTQCTFYGSSWTLYQSIRKYDTGSSLSDFSNSSSQYPKSKHKKFLVVRPSPLLPDLPRLFSLSSFVGPSVLSGSVSSPSFWLGSQ